jgi:hypothetical protein
MAKNTIADLDTTASNNTDVLAQSTQGTAAVSTIDTMIQNSLALLARFYADLGGTGTVGGTADAITLTTASTYQALENGLTLAFKAGSANTGAATINVDSLGAKAIRRIGDSALSAGDIAANGVYLLRYDTAYNGAAGAWILLNSGSGTAATTSAAGIVPLNYFGISQNISFTGSVGSSALTVALKGADGNDPSASNPVIIPFRNVTAATGTPSFLTVTAATSIVISSGSTMGTTSGAISRLWIVGFNDGGTFRLGLVNCLSGTSIMALRPGIYSSTAEGGAGAADSAHVIYTGTAVSSKAMTVLGYLESTQATAGTWASAPSVIKIYQPGDGLPGDRLQIQRTQTGAVATGTTTIPNDDTIPQNTEGTEFMTQAITPLAAANVLKVNSLFIFGCSATANVMAALFQDSTANALAVNDHTIVSGVYRSFLTLGFAKLSGQTTSTTFKVRAGGEAASTITFNGSAGARLMGGAMGSFLEVEEIVA